MSYQSYNIPTMALTSGFQTFSLPALSLSNRKHQDDQEPVRTPRSSESESHCFKHLKNFIANYIQNALVQLLAFFVVWATFYVLFGDSALPGGSLFVIAILVPLGILLGTLAEKMCIPPLVGMLVAGLILSNVPSINIAGSLDISVSSPLRGISIVILLTRGALSVNYNNVRKYITIVPSLAIGSCIIEGFCASIAVYLIVGFPLQWSFLMGCIMSAMSGVVVMPILGNIEKNGQICQEFSSSIVIAKTACGLDAILGICMAEVAIGFIYSQGEVELGLMKGPLDILVGAAFGTLWGSLAGILLNKTSNVLFDPYNFDAFPYKMSFCDEIRTLVTLCGGIMSLLGLYKVGYGRGGPLATFLGTLIAASFWRSRETDGSNNDQLNKYFTQLWFFFQPLLFGIIGARTDLLTVDWHVVALGISCLTISLTVRIFAAYALSSFGTLSVRERIFIALTWIPKGTVQAALGPVALDLCRDFKLGEENEILAYKVMNIAVATILIASTLGGISLYTLGPKVLRR